MPDKHLLGPEYFSFHVHRCSVLWGEAGINGLTLEPRGLLYQRSVHTGEWVTQRFYKSGHMKFQFPKCIFNNTEVPILYKGLHFK